jgi:hypothetical protein
MQTGLFSMQYRSAVLWVARGITYFYCSSRHQHAHHKTSCTGHVFKHAAACLFGLSLQVFEAVAQPLLGPVLGGTSATVLAYGVTSSGKTHTMMGRQAPPPATAADASSNSSSSGGEAGLDTGLVQRCLAELFAAFHQATDR